MAAKPPCASWPRAQSSDRSKAKHSTARATAALGAVLLALLPAPASGERLLDEGVRLFNAGEFERSLQVLRRAQPAAREELARVHLYVGLGHAFLGHVQKARAAFATALGHDPTLELDPERIKESVVLLFRQVRAGLAGWIRVEADREGARVSVDGQEVGEVPSRLQVAPGWHRVEVRSAGGTRSAERRVLVSAGQEALFRAELGDVLQHREAQQPPPLVLRRPAAPRGRRIWTWVAAGTALGLLAIGGGVWGWGAGLHADAQAAIDADPSLFDNPVRRGQLEDSYGSKYIAGQVLVSLGVALAATSVVLYFLEPRTREARRATAEPGLVVAPLPGGAGVAGRF